MDEPHTPMRPCCMSVIVAAGAVTGFKLTPEGEGFTCPTCGTVYRIVNGKWTRVRQGGTDE